MPVNIPLRTTIRFRKYYSFDIICEIILDKSYIGAIIILSRYDFRNNIFEIILLTMFYTLGKDKLMSEKNKIDHKSIVDKALGFATGEAFCKDLEALMNEADNEGCSTIIIALFDLDNFMLVNNSFGHDEGDRVLITTGKYIKEALPEGATPYRIGGDEMGIIFNCGMEKEEVFLLMESIRKSYDVKLPDGSAQTISIGIATAFEDATRVPELMRKAESALFRAKVNGRNKVALAKEEKMVPKTSHYTADQLSSLTKLSKREGVGEAILLREALDMLLKKYDV